MSRTPHLVLSGLLLTGALAACESKRDDATKSDVYTEPTVPAQTTRGETPPPTAPVAPQTTETTAPAAAMSDADIAAVTQRANQNDIDAAKLALSKTKNGDVKAFAQMMIKDHSKAFADTKALLDKLALEPRENEMSQEAAEKGKSTGEELKGLSGAEFDQAYASAMVKAHQGTLDKIDQKLLPAASNAEFKSLLQSIRPVVAEHLEHAKALEQKLQK